MPYIHAASGCHVPCFRASVAPRWPRIHVDPRSGLALLMRGVERRDGVHVAVPRVLGQNPLKEHGGRRGRLPCSQGNSGGFLGVGEGVLGSVGGLVL